VAFEGAANLAGHVWNTADKTKLQAAKVPACMQSVRRSALQQFGGAPLARHARAQDAIAQAV